MPSNENREDYFYALYANPIPSMENDSNSTPLANDGMSSNDSRIPPPSHDTPLDASLTSLETHSSPGGHQGPTGAPSTLYNTAQGTLTADNTVGTQNNSDGRPSMPCLYPRADGTACLDQITCCDVPEHFKKAHDVRDLKRSYWLFCKWKNCGRKITRHNFVRHIRECHFKQGRISVHKCSAGHTHGHNSGG
ncbi:hypothetical protein F5141DRAFT_288892 [Pisolithus sp. B1]|nr:hypothetical protein F5141DRAFT_288892 [Pisolithus sp. B1]